MKTGITGLAGALMGVFMSTAHANEIPKAAPIPLLAFSGDTLLPIIRPAAPLTYPMLAEISADQLAKVPFSVASGLPAPVASSMYAPGVPVLDLTEIKATIPSMVNIVENTALTIYQIPATTEGGESKARLVFQDDITGRACVQEHPGVTNKIQSFVCFNAEEGVPDITRGQNISATQAEKPPISNSDGVKVEMIELKPGTLGKYYDLQVGYLWNPKVQEVCATLIQNRPVMAVFEMGCAPIEGRNYINRVPPQPSASL